MAETINCPKCKRELKVPDHLIGKKVKCPSCSTMFIAEEALEEGEVDEEPQDVPRKARKRPSTAKDDDEVPRKRRRPPDDDEDQPPRRRGISSGYSIDAGEWFHFAKEHFWDAVWPMIGYYFVMGIVVSLPIYLAVLLTLSLIATNPVFAIAVGLFSYLLGVILLVPPLSAGFVVVGLAEIKGERWSFGDFFGGFRYFVPLIANMFLSNLIYLGCMLPTLALIGIGAAAGSGTLLGVANCFSIPNNLIALYVMVRTNFFAIPLIIDRNCGAIEAIEKGWRLSEGHALGLFGMALLVGLVAASGVILCGIGLFFTVPFAILTYCSGYLLCAGTRPPRPSWRSRDRRPRYDEDDDE